MRSTKRAWVTRINAAVKLLKHRRSQSEAAEALAADHGVSRRQAYRYVREAKDMRQAVALPEEKVVFTVKLPMSLALKARRLAKSSGETVSLIVTQALERFLRRGR
jgi:predicted DNA-binding transcriptional regulator YafY